MSAQKSKYLHRTEEPGPFALPTRHTFGIQVEQVANICPSELGQKHNGVTVKLHVPL